MKLTFTGHVRNGDAIWDQPEEVAKSIKQFENKKIECEIRLWKGRSRSEKQNRYYWGVIIKIYTQCLKDAGYADADEWKVHGMLADRYLQSVIINESTGEAIPYTMSTTKLTTVETEEYFENCRRDCAENFGGNIPLPNEEIEEHGKI